MIDNIDDDADECPVHEIEADGIVTIPLSEEEKRVFKQIDRNGEDEMVRQYSLTHDESILGKLYDIRKPTFEIMAKKYAHLENRDDMFGEFMSVWMKCIRHYEFDPKSRPIKTKGGSVMRYKNGKIKTTVRHTPFNSYFFTAMLNRIRNINKRNRNKKRLDGNGDPVAETMMSLDYEYGEDATPMIDMMSGSGSEHVRSSLVTNDMISKIAGGDFDVKKALHAVAFGTGIRSIKEACQRRSGSMRISSRDYRILVMSNKMSLDYLEHMIRATGVFPKKFKILNYIVQGHRVFFNIAVRDPKLCSKVIRAVNRKKNLLIEETKSGLNIDRQRRRNIFSVSPATDE